MPAFKITLADGSVHTVDAETEQDAVAKLQASFIRQQAQPTKHGAPARVRVAVGAAPPEGRLATIRQFYPDARPYGSDNFIYTDPADGQLTLYNPEGLDWGDIPAVIPEMAGLVGGGLGAAAGSAAGPPGTLAGAGAGTLAGEELARSALQMAMPEIQDPRSHLARTGDQINTALLGAAGEGVGRWVGEGVEGLARGALTSPAGRQTLQEASDLGLDTTGMAGEIGGRPLTRMTTNTLAAVPSSANVMGDARAASVDSFTGRMLGLSQRRSQGEGAQALREGQEAAAAGFWTQERALKDTMDQAVGDLAVTPGDMPGLQRLVRTWQNQMAANPTAASHLEGAVREAEGLLQDAAAGGIPYSLLRERMTHITQSLQNPAAGTGYVGKSGQAMRKLERTLRDDARSAVAANRPDATGAVSAYDSFVAEHLAEGVTGKSAAGVIEQMGKRETDQLMNYALGGAKGGSARLRQLRDLMPAEQWETFQQAVLHRMGSRGGGSEEFSIKQFTTRWRDMDDSAKRTLFGDDYDFLNRMAAIGEDMKKVEAEANASKTAQTMMLGQALQGTAGAGAGLTAGDMGSALLGTTAAVGVPWAAAKGITSPGFANFAMGAPIPGLEALAGSAGRMLSLTPEAQQLMELESQ